MRPLAVLGLVGALHALTAVEPGAVLHLTDLERSRERWAVTPYPALLNTAWARWVDERLTVALASVDVDRELLFAAAAAQQRVSAGLLSDPDDADAAPILIVTGSGPIAAVAPLLGDDAIAAIVDQQSTWLTGAGDLMASGDGWLWRQTRLAQPFAPLPTLPVPMAHEDVVFVLEPGFIDAFQRFIDEDDDSVNEPAGQRITLTLESFGLHERQVQILSPERAVRLRANPPPPAPRAALLALPGDTLWAISLGWDAQSLYTWAEPELKADKIANLDRAFARLAIGSVSELCRDLRDDVRLWCRAAAPFPTLWFDAGCIEARARLILGALRDHAGFTVTDDLTATGPAGPLTVHVAWHDGRLRITTDPFGFEGPATAQTFGDRAEIRAASAHWVDDAFVLGASRSGASWGAVAGLVQLGLLAQGHRQFASLAADLTRTGTHGFVSGSITADGHVAFDAGGLCGGTIGWLLTGGGGALLYYQSLLAELAKPGPLPE